MRTNVNLTHRFNRLAKLVNRIVAESTPNLYLASQPFEAEQLIESGKNFVFALEDSIEVLQEKEGAI